MKVLHQQHYLFYGERVKQALAGRQWRMRKVINSSGSRPSETGCWEFGWRGGLGGGGCDHSNVTVHTVHACMYNVMWCGACSLFGGCVLYSGFLAYFKLLLDRKGFRNISQSNLGTRLTPFVSLSAILACLLLLLLLPPWYNRTGWLGLKHQVTTTNVLLFFPS